MTRKMKDSGIEWIGEIPEEWNVGKLKTFAYFKTGTTPTETDGSTFIGEFKWYTPGDFSDQIILTESSRTLNKNIAEKKLVPIYPSNSVLIVGIGATVGKIGYTLEESSSNQQITAIVSKGEFYPKYLMYFLLGTIDVIKENALYTTLPILNNQTLGQSIVVLPDMSSQKQIANYLDNKCAKVDETIEKQKHVVEKLKAYKRSVITEAVTKGLNPDVPIKDSGIDWIGKIPEHWEIKKLKFEFIIKKDIAGQEGYDILSVTQRGIKIKDISNNEGQIAMDYSKYQLVDIDDYVMNHMDLLTGFVDCSEYIGVTSPDYRVFKLINKDNSKEYFKYIFQCCYFNKIFYGLGQGVSGLGRWRLQTDKFLNFSLPIPPIREQFEIADYIDKKCAAVDATIAQKETLIQKLTDYKKSLIFECVTGKREV